MELKRPTLKRADMGVVGAIVVASQLLTALESTRALKEEISHLRSEFAQSQVEREVLFVRKSDVGQILDKLDRMSTQITQLRGKLGEFSSQYIPLEDSEYEQVSLLESHQIKKIIAGTNP